MDKNRSKIHPTAVIESGACIGDNVSIGPYTIVESDVRIGDGCEIGAHAVIGSKTTLGAGCRIFHSAIVGTIAQDKKYRGEETTLTIGDNTCIREFCTINRGTSASGTTTIGKNCLFLAYSHVGHDCIIGDSVIMSNNVALAGHVWIGSYANISAASAIHQFCRIGEYSFVGASSHLAKDVLPFGYCANRGRQATERIIQINKIGLERAGFSPEQLNVLNRSFRILFRQGLTIEEAIAKLQVTYNANPLVERIISFMKESQRGFYRMLV